MDGSSEDENAPKLAKSGLATIAAAAADADEADEVCGAFAAPGLDLVDEAVAVDVAGGHDGIRLEGSKDSKALGVSPEAAAAAASAAAEDAAAAEAGVAPVAAVAPGVGGFFDGGKGCCTAPAAGTAAPFPSLAAPGLFWYLEAILARFCRADPPSGGLLR